MRKKVFGRKLSRDRGSRTALFRALVRSMVQHGKIVTTKAKAKAIQPAIEKLVSVSKSKDIAVIRRVFSYLGNDKRTVEILFNNIAKSFQNRKSGFTRVINLPRRMGDFAEMVRMEWTDNIEVESKKLEVGKNKKTMNSKGVRAETVKESKSGIRSKVSSLLRKKK